MARARPTTIRTVCGYSLLALSFLAWGAILALPLFQISVGLAAALTTGLIIGGEVSFYLGIALLGKDVWDKIKAFFRISRGRGRGHERGRGHRRRHGREHGRGHGRGGHGHGRGPSKG